jgi:hypothetical protein
MPRRSILTAAERESLLALPAFVMWLLASPTPERVQEIRGRVSDEGVGIIARGVLETLLGQTVTSERNFEQFSQRFKELPEAFSKALFGANYQRLQDMAVTSDVLFH